MTAPLGKPVEQRQLEAAGFAVVPKWATSPAVPWLRLARAAGVPERRGPYMRNDGGVVQALWMPLWFVASVEAQAADELWGYLPGADRERRLDALLRHLLADEAGQAALATVADLGGAPTVYTWLERYALQAVPRG